MWSQWALARVSSFGCATAACLTAPGNSITTRQSINNRKEHQSGHFQFVTSSGLASDNRGAVFSVHVASERAKVDATKRAFDENRTARTQWRGLVHLPAGAGMFCYLAHQKVAAGHERGLVG